LLKNKDYNGNIDISIGLLIISSLAFRAARIYFKIALTPAAKRIGTVF